MIGVQGDVEEANVWVDDLSPDMIAELEALGYGGGGDPQESEQDGIDGADPEAGDPNTGDRKQDE